MADVKVLTVPEGSIVVLTDVTFADNGDNDGINFVVEELARIAGHERFLVLQIQSGADVVVWGPATDPAGSLSWWPPRRKEGNA